MAFVSDSVGKTAGKREEQCFGINYTLGSFI